MAQKVEDEEIDILAIAGTLWRGKWLMLVFATIAVVIGAFYAFALAEPKYAATTSLALQIQGEQIVDIQSVVSGVSTETAAINTELEVIRSRGLLEKLVKTLDLIADSEFNSALQTPSKISMASIKRSIKSIISLVLPTANETPALTPLPTSDLTSVDQLALNRTVDAVRRGLRATNQRNTYVFLLRATTSDPIKSARIANTLAELYIQDQIDIKFQATENAVAWLSDRVTELEADLEQKEDAIKEVRATIEYASPEALNAVSQRARDIRERVFSEQANIIEINAQVTRLIALREMGDLTQMAEALGNQTLNRLLQQVENGSSAARATFLSRYDVLVAQHQSQLTRSQQLEETLATSLATIEAEVSSQSKQLGALEQLERDALATRTLYETFLTRLKETSVQRGIQQADSRVLSRAPPGLYVEPRKSRIIVISCILGLICGAFVVLIRQFLHNGIRTSEELEHLTGLSTLGQIPSMPVRKRDELIPYLNNSPTSASSEAIRNLRTSVLLSNVDHQPKIIMSTSAVPGDGKTTLAISLAHNLAGLGKKVLLMECDIRRRTFSQYFDIPEKSPGLIAALTGGTPIEDIVLRDPRINVDVLVGEKTGMNAADVFSSEKFRALLETLRDIYDYVIIDTPPVLVVPDARVIGGAVDAIVFNVAWDRTSRQQVTESLRQFETVNVNVTGMVLSQVNPKGMKRYGYGKNYGAYSSYNSGYYDT